MRQYRQLDDGVTTRLNRTLAQSRSSGQSPSPSLLSTTGSSSTSYTDLGKSTYSTLNQSACESFFRELVSNWSGRESVLRYCLAIVDVQGQAAEPVKRTRQSELSLLDADRVVEQQGTQATSGGGNRPIFTEWDSRGSRAEKADEALVSWRRRTWRPARLIETHFIILPIPRPLARSPTHTATTDSQRSERRSDCPHKVAAGIQVEMHPV